MPNIVPANPVGRNEDTSDFGSVREAARLLLNSLGLGAHTVNLAYGLLVMLLAVYLVTIAVAFMINVFDGNITWNYQIMVVVVLATAIYIAKPTRAVIFFEPHFRAFVEKWLPLVALCYIATMLILSTVSIEDSPEVFWGLIALTMGIAVFKIYDPKLFGGHLGLAWLYRAIYATIIITVATIFNVDLLVYRYTGVNVKALVTSTPSERAAKKARKSVEMAMERALVNKFDQISKKGGAGVTVGERNFVNWYGQPVKGGGKLLVIHPDEWTSVGGDGFTVEVTRLDPENPIQRKLGDKIETLCRAPIKCPSTVLNPVEFFSPTISSDRLELRSVGSPIFVKVMEKKV